MKRRSSGGQASRKPQCKSRRPFCEFFQSGLCTFGDDCWYNHAERLVARSEAADSEDDADQAPAKLSLKRQRPPCEFFARGLCTFGEGCWFAHVGRSSSTSDENTWSKDEWDCEGPTWSNENWNAHGSWDLHEVYSTSSSSTAAMQEAVADCVHTPSAFLRFVVPAPWSLRHRRQHWDPVGSHLDTGPMRLRVAGSIEKLGFYGGQWDPNYGTDLIWEGTGWASVLVPVPPDTEVEFNVMCLEQSMTFPGTLQGTRRFEIHESRKFTWSANFCVRSPSMIDRVLEVNLAEDVAWELWRGIHSAGAEGATPAMRERPLEECLAFPSLSRSLGCELPPPGEQRVYTLRGPGPDPSMLHFGLYLPPGFNDAGKVPEGGWPLLLFLHSMHGRFDGDMNLFYESETPVRLLLGDPGCPRALSERFVVLCPQCPTDQDRGDGGGVWLRHGYYEHSTYASELEAALRSLIECSVSAFGVNHDRIAITGSSMGAYAALELASRWPRYFSACAPVAAHYDLDPVGPLIDKLTGPQALPLWFFHARNDNVCPVEPVEAMVSELRRRSRAEVRLTAFTDTWSNQGHCADRVPYWAEPQVAGQAALGNELFAWLAEHRRSLL